MVILSCPIIPGLSRITDYAESLIETRLRQKVPAGLKPIIEE